MPRHSNIPEKIISMLSANPAITRKDLSIELEVSYQAVQKHLNTLQKQGFVTPSFTVIQNKVKKYLFYVFIVTRSPLTQEQWRAAHQHAGPMGNDYQKRLCKEIAESFQKNSPLVDGLVFGGVNIVIGGGNHDIILTLFSDGPDPVGHYVTQFLRAHPAIRSTSTAWSLSLNSGEERQAEDPQETIGKKAERKKR